MNGRPPCEQAPPAEPRPSRAGCYRQRVIRNDSAAYLDSHLEAIRTAATRIKGHIRRTPVLATDLGDGLVLKPECLQVTGSFKARGAFNAVLRLVERPDQVKGVIAVSSGNHAQAVARAARVAGLPATILIPAGGNPLKVAATRSYGAEVITEGIDFANREARVAEYQQRLGLTLVHPFDDWDVIHGQATATLELLEDDPEVALVAAPIGGGGLLSGTALAAKAIRPAVQVFGVEPAAADDAARSFQSRSIVTLSATPDTIADGVRTVSIGKRSFEVMIGRQLVDGIVTVSEQEIEEAVRMAWLRLHLALEPTGALPLAAHLAGKLPRVQGHTALILSGGNFDPAVLSRLFNK